MITNTAAMKFSKVLSGCLAAGVFLSGCSLFSGGLDDEWFPEDVVAPVGLPIYEVTPKAVQVPFFDTAVQVETVADLLEVDVEVVQSAVDESLEGEHEGTQTVLVPVQCDLPVESSLAAVSYLHPDYVWQSKWVESYETYVFGIEMAPGFDEVANTASASWDITGPLTAAMKRSSGDGSCTFVFRGLQNDFEIVGYTEVSRSALEARDDIEELYDLVFGEFNSIEDVAAVESYWLPARISYLRDIAAFSLTALDPDSYLVHPVFYVGGDEAFGGIEFAFAPVDPGVAAAEIRFLESQGN